MKHTSLATVLGSAFLLLGLSVPGCPDAGSQQQLEGLQAKNSELMKQSQAHDAQLKALQAEMSQAKALIGQMGQTVLAQKEALTKMEETLAVLRTANPSNHGGHKAPAPAPAAHKTAPAHKAAPTHKSAGHTKKHH